MIAPGTLCWIIRTEPGNERMLGRVVTVVSPLQAMVDRGGELMHEIDAPWLREERPGCKCYAPPSALRPITPPDDEVPAPSTAMPATA